MTDIKTVDLSGTELAVNISGANICIKNCGIATIYASVDADVVADAPGVLPIDPGTSAILPDCKGTIYLLGSGKVVLAGGDTKFNLFCRSVTSGGSGTDEVARAAITAHAGNADVHVTAAQKSAWDATLPYIGVVEDLFNVKKTCVCAWNSSTLNTPLKAGLTNAGGGLCIINNTSGSTYTSYLVMVSGGTEVFLASSNAGVIRDSWLKISDSNADTLGGYPVGINGKKGVLILPEDNGTLEIGQRIDFHSAGSQDYAVRLYVSPPNWDSASSMPSIRIATPDGTTANIADGGNAASVGIYTAEKLAALEARVAALEGGT